MSKLKKYLMAANLLAIMVFFAFSVISKEKLFNNGRVVLLELQPVDPRSIMQGDYMELNYVLSSHVWSNTYGRQSSVKYEENIPLESDSAIADVVIIDTAAVASEDDEVVVPRPDDSYFEDYCVVKVGTDKVATFTRMLLKDDNLKSDELILHCRYIDGSRPRFVIGAESYFFQEGSGEKYANARYGMLKVDNDGNCMLVGLCDEHRELIK